VSKLAPDLLARIESLGRTLPEQRAKLEADWRVLAESVPGALGALAKKLEDHGQPPAGMPDRAQFDSARSRLDAARAKWAEAEALTSTNLSKAVAMADEVRLEAVAALTEFGQRGS
jgi:hypothetical protein